VGASSVALPRRVLIEPQLDQWWTLPGPFWRRGHLTYFIFNRPTGEHSWLLPPRGLRSLRLPRRVRRSTFPPEVIPSAAGAVLASYLTRLRRGLAFLALFDALRLAAASRAPAAFLETNKNPQGP